MDEELIDALAYALYTKLGELRWRQEQLVWMGDVEAVANVIHDFQPTYDLRYFFKACGYPKPYPRYPMED